VLNVEDVRAAHTELSERGIEFSGAPEDESGAHTHPSRTLTATAG
jgi:quercetin dioxygenase-like cupin family protein